MLLCAAEMVRREVDDFPTAETIGRLTVRQSARNVAIGTDWPETRMSSGKYWVGIGGPVWLNQS